MRQTLKTRLRELAAASGRLVELGSMGSSRILRVHEAFKKVDSKLQAAQKKVGGDYMRAADLPKWFAIQSIRDRYGRIDDLQLKKFKYRVNRVKRSEFQSASGRLVEFSVAWARRLKNLSPESVRRLRDGLREQTRQAGGKVGRGADFRVYESFTPGRGRTVTKTLVPDALKERDEVVASAKKAWADVEASPAGRQSALPIKWHDSGYVQDRMINPDTGKPVGSRFAEKISSGFEPERAKAVGPFTSRERAELRKRSRSKGEDVFEDVFAMPQGANDSSLIIQRHTSSSRTPNKSNILAHNIMLDPRKRRLVLTDPLGWQSSSKAKGSTDGPRPWLTPGPAVR